MLLYRYILVELLRVMLLTTAVLTIVIAFGAAIRPLALDLLGPFDLLKYILIATVPMLQFSLPLAAGFGATIVMHRLAADNEVLAMTAAGLSYRRIMMPVFVLATALLVVMLGLTHFVIPRFGRLLEEIIARDVTRLFVSAVQEGQAIRIGDVEIFADEVQVAPGPRETGADTRLVLAGVAAIQRKAGQPEVEFTAEYATVDVHRRAGGTFLKPALVNATVFRADEGTFAWLPEAEPDAVLLGSHFSNPLNFLTLPEMLDPSSWIDGHRPVEDGRRQLANVLGETEAWMAVDRAVRSGPLRLRDGFGGREFVIDAGALDGVRLLPPAGARLRMVELQAGVPQREALADEARLAWTPPVMPDGVGTFDLLVSEPEVRGLRDGLPRAGRWPPRIGPLRLVGWTPDPIADQRWESLAARGEAIPQEAPGPASLLAQRGRNAAVAVRNVVADTRRQLDGRITKRTALAVSGFLVLALGGVLAVWLHKSVPLAVYIVAFLPAIGSTLLIAGGEGMLQDGYVLGGHAVLWSGCAALLVLLALAWHKMSRN
ncbi:MAG: LptF/LptG family permease [Phycisphaerales bacterium]|nr:LptF/LptG family permease [Phycisphaerales bacterium]